MPRLAILTTEQKQFLDQLIRKAETGEGFSFASSFCHSRSIEGYKSLHSRAKESPA
jgi:hypothetical protein